MKFKTLSNTAFLALGSNVGDRIENLNRAIVLLKQNKMEISAQSKWYETEPYPKNTPNNSWHINGVVKVVTTLSPRDLMETLQKIETEMGRTSNREKNSPRAIDIDIIFYNNEIINNGGIVIPHQDVENRRFVLTPLCDIAPDAIHPVLKRTAKDLLSLITGDLKVICCS